MKELDLTKLPIGTVVYSIMYGYGRITNINTNNDPYPITVSHKGDINFWYTKQGKVSDILDGEVIIFPSKENRDWESYFKEEEQSKLYSKLKPTMFVLVRNCKLDTWKLDIFSHFLPESNNYSYACLKDNYIYCIPYEGNEHLLNTINSK